MFSSSKRRGLTLVEVFMVIVIAGLLLCLLLPAVNVGREGPRRAACINTLQQFGLALHNFHDARKRFPSSSTQSLLSASPPVPGSNNADGNGAGYSWQAMLLPFVEESSQYWENVGHGSPYDKVSAHQMRADVPVVTGRVEPAT